MSDQPRTKDEAILDLKYVIRLHQLHCRLLKRTRATLAAISVGSGLAAISDLVQTTEYGVLASGLVVAVCSVIDALSSFSEKAALHAQSRRRLLELLADSAEMDADQIDRRRRLIDAENDHEIESLRLVAFNDNVRSSGHEDWARPESVYQRFVRALA